MAVCLSKLENSKGFLQRRWSIKANSHDLKKLTNRIPSKAPGNEIKISKLLIFPYVVKICMYFYCFEVEILVSIFFSWLEKIYQQNPFHWKIFSHLSLKPILLYSSQNAKSKFIYVRRLN